LARTILDLQIPACEHVYYCDDAYLRITRELKAKKTFDLLNTDIAFVEDHRSKKLNSGIDLIKASKETYQALEVIVFSVESRAKVVKSFFNDLNIDGFVQKGTMDAFELVKVVLVITNGGNFMSPRIKEIIHPSKSYQSTKYDLTILSLLASGTMLKNIPKNFWSLIFNQKE